ncbi:hypothetical protein [Parasphingorhabdus halotolerans]|uniref:Haem-binding uptake Tiki superfamily ChaN domain-containing protein n=1 Tax=Parasphingorhabdus halotolerans TaxID=2725558 RepID=A0A6H2DMZ7_9SPHN|nr:hypothetical protein [Parasphingorhabdus halotolerans]QJB69507.1 hypothetical protein HF685_09620 [Parasphingorhabdus halotolerans]
MAHQVLRYLFVIWFAALASCSVEAEPDIPEGTTIVAVVGAIHAQHKRSKTYSLDILRTAIKRFNPDIVMVELPPDRFATASSNYQKFGEVRESRADDFPELVDVVFPLRAEMGFEMVPVAAWSQQTADARKAAMARIEQDPKRAADWQAFQAAIKDYNESVSGRSDDPAFIHSAAYDQAVKARQETDENLFGDDLGAGGWANVNASHIALMTGKLDAITGHGKRVLILFGAWHKYKIMEEMEARSDVFVFDASELF